MIMKMIYVVYAVARVVSIFVLSSSGLLQPDSLGQKPNVRKIYRYESAERK